MTRLLTPRRLMRGQPCWLETRDGKLDWVEVAGIDRLSDKIHGKYEAYDLHFLESYSARYRYECTYNVTWRVWERKPTDEERAEAEWLPDV